ncbi:MAG: flavin reductase, partial [Methyloceanibacter sp.]
MSGSVAALFQRLTQGVYVVGVAHGEVRNAFTAAWVMQVSFDPLLLALSINPHHSSYGLLRGGRAFSVNVLKKGQLELAAHYGGRAEPDIWTAAQHDLPIVFVVMRNEEYSILKSFALLEKAPGVPGMDLPGLDIVSIATGFGCRAVH